MSRTSGAADVREFYDKYAGGHRPPAASCHDERQRPPDRLPDQDRPSEPHQAQTFADWIANGGATEGFSTFVDQCKACGLDTYQKALDAFNAN